MVSRCWSRSLATASTPPSHLRLALCLPGVDDFVVDLGCDKFCILRNGEVLASRLCARTTSTKISFSLQDFTRRLFGADARYTKDYLTIHGYMQILGLESTNSKVIKYIEYYALHDLVRGQNNATIFNWLKNRDLIDGMTIEHAVAILLLNIKHEFMKDICIGTRLSMIVPNDWNDRQKRLMLLACKYSNIVAGRLIPSGTALAMQYAVSKKSTLPSKVNPGSKYVLLIDIGMTHCTFTLALYSFRAPHKNVKSSTDKTNHIRIINSLTECDHIHGMNINRLINDIIVAKYEAIYGSIQDKKLLSHVVKGKLDEEINDIKKSFSLGAKEVRVCIDRFYGHHDFNVTITKTEFENKFESLLAPLKSQFIRLISEVNLTVNDVYEVELVGGSMRLPIIREYINNNVLLKSKSIKMSLNTDEGAALGGMSIMSNDELEVHDILYNNYFVQINDQKCVKLYKRGDQLCQLNKKQIRANITKQNKYVSLVILSAVSGDEQLTPVSSYLVYPPTMVQDSTQLVVTFAINPIAGIVYVQNIECEVDKRVLQVHSRLIGDHVVAVSKICHIEDQVNEAVAMRDIKVNRRNEIESMLLQLQKNNDLAPNTIDLIASINTWLDEAVYTEKQMNEFDEFFHTLNSIHSSMPS